MVPAQRTHRQLTDDATRTVVIQTACPMRRGAYEGRRRARAGSDSSVASTATRRRARCTRALAASAPRESTCSQHVVCKVRRALRRQRGAAVATARPGRPSPSRTFVSSSAGAAVHRAELSGAATTQRALQSLVRVGDWRSVAWVRTKVDADGRSLRHCDCVACVIR